MKTLWCAMLILVCYNAIMSGICCEPTFAIRHSESIDEYTHRLGIPRDISIEIGNEQCIRCVLIPAGEYVMGLEVNTFDFRRTTQYYISLGLLVFGGFGVIGICAYILCIAVARRRLQWSLRAMISVSLLSGICVVGVSWMEDAQQTNELVAYCDEETPAHRVVISRPFYMAINEITIEEYRTVMEHVKNKSLAKTSFKYKDEYQLKSKLRKDKYPASNVPWDAADMFCKQLSKNTGMVIRLPTEAEWEYACKAGSGSLFGNGNTVEALSEIAWYEANSDGTHHPVGMKSGNRYGLHDMLGNAGEWCLDGLRQYTAESVVDPVGNNGENTERCVRGGWSTSAPWGCRTSRRFSGDVGDVGFGFRIIVAPYEIKIMP